MADQQQQQQQHQQSPPGLHGCKRMSLEKIIEAMTADLESSAGHYVHFGMSPQQQQSSSQNWDDYTGVQTQNFMSAQAIPSNPQNASPPMNPISSPIYMQEPPQFDTTRPEPMYFPPQVVNHLGINDKNDLVGTIDVGGGNYIDVIYGNASQIVAEQCQLNSRGSYRPTQSTIDREYGLFTDQQQLPVSHKLTANQSANGTQLIDNLVGNWLPNQSGTYSPFGGSPNVTPVPQAVLNSTDANEKLSRNVTDVQQKKPRMIAEVKPMRPSYSDVLTKSAPPPPSPMTGPVKAQFDQSMTKKSQTKNGKHKTKPVLLKRQNSSGSDDHGSPKMQIPKKNFERNSTNLSRRWVSLDNLGSQTESHDINPFNRSDNFEKKKIVKTGKKCEKTETLNNSKFQNSNSKNSGNLQKRPIQINNNLNNINSFNQSLSGEKIEKNQHANNKINKDDKKMSKEKSSKRFHVDKNQQMKKGQKYRNRDNRESPIKDFCRNLNKYASRWSKFGLKVFYWLLHLISDVLAMSTNLVMQFGTCLWYHSVLYTKYSWVYLAAKFSKVQFLNTIGKRIDDWFGSTSKFAFWRRIKSKKTDDKDENRSWMHGGLETNIALPSTGEEAMKRLLACKGKDPYSILGVTPTCSDDDIKKYYKRQAFLVHPDKNSQPGAEEAFKILVHAFDIIGEPERRKAFDQVWQVEAAWGEMSGLLSQLHRKMEQAANTIRCTNCGLRHKRVPTQRPCYAARFCAQCKIRHSAKEGDIWAESRVMGFLWHYYACMEGAVYDVTEWAACQAGNLKHLRANTHSVQYRIVSGQRPPSQTSVGGKRRQHNDPSTSEADLEDFLNNLYNHSKSGASGPPSEQQSTTKPESRRRKAKRK